MVKYLIYYSNNLLDIIKLWNKMIKIKAVIFHFYMPQYFNVKNNTLEMNNQNKDKGYPLLLSIINNNIEMINLFIDYADNNNIILIMNKKINNDDYPVNCATINNNVKMLNILIEYANKHHIILKSNKQNEKGVSTLHVIRNNNITMVKLLIEYSYFSLVLMMIVMMIITIYNNKTTIIIIIILEK